MIKDNLGIFVCGANGRMGKNIIQIVAEDKTMALVGATERMDSPVQGADAGLNAGSRQLSVSITADLGRALQKHRGVIIDFSSTESTLGNLERAVQYGAPIVVGTTGFDTGQMGKIKEAAQKIAIVHAPNMSMTMNILFQIVAQAAKILNEEYDIEVFEAHHRNKIDAPSGTAMKVAQVLCEATGRQFPDDINFHRQGVIGARQKNEIGMQVLRGGDIVGEHSVFFCGTGERLEIKHVATSRTTFAAGSIRAAKWLKDKKAGLYDMQDVLGLR